jgi:hypothetical protein
VDRKAITTPKFELLGNKTFIRYHLCRLCKQIRMIPTSCRKIAAGAPFAWTLLRQGRFARRFRAGTGFTHSVWTSGCALLGPVRFANIALMGKYGYIPVLVCAWVYTYPGEESTMCFVQYSMSLLSIYNIWHAWCSYLLPYSFFQ